MVTGLDLFPTRDGSSPAALGPDRSAGDAGATVLDVPHEPPPEAVLPVDGDGEVVPAVRVGRRVHERPAAARLDRDAPGPVPYVVLVDIAERTYQEGQGPAAGVAQGEVQIAVPVVDARGDLRSPVGRSGELAPEAVRPGDREAVRLPRQRDGPVRGVSDVLVLRGRELMRRTGTARSGPRTGRCWRAPRAGSRPTAWPGRPAGTAAGAPGVRRAPARGAAVRRAASAASVR